jgi:hypothetical protein
MLKALLDGEDIGGNFESNSERGGLSDVRFVNRLNSARATGRQ